MAYQTRFILEDLKAIIEAEDYFQKVSIEKLVPLDQEEVFPSCYIVNHTNTFEFNGRATTGTTGYDANLLITLCINLNMETELEYLDVQDMIMRAVLRDSKIWRYVLDRDIKLATWDFNERFPKKEGQITFEFKHRLCDENC
jgi:hypothetical protein